MSVPKPKCLRRGARLSVLVVFVGLAFAMSTAALENGRDERISAVDPMMVEELSKMTRHLDGAVMSAPDHAPPGANIPLGGTNEPTVVVDPNNTQNVAMASLRSLRVSTDGGLTFQPAVLTQIPATHGRCGDPSLAFDSQGRLFWTYLGCTSDAMGNLTGIDIFIAQVNTNTGAIMAGYPTNVTASAGLPAPGNFHDKEWLAADFYAGSPFQDNLYIVWSDLTVNGASVVRSTFSTDQGLNWSVPVALSNGVENFVWPSHNTVAPNGDVYVTYHDQTTFAGGPPSAPNGTSGRVFVLRSTDGGVSFPQKTTPFGPGQADITFNRQAAPGTIPGTQFWLQGSAQPWVLADPNTPGRIYVVANDDPDNNHGAGDDADVFISISTNSGVNWNAPVRIDDGPGTTFQIMPTAAIDANTGCIVLHYYDNRNGATNAAGRFLLDVFAQASNDGGVTWGPSIQLNDNAFDPDPGAACRFGPTANCGTVGDPVSTFRIGEYNGVAVADGLGFAVWCGNTVDGGGNPVGQQTIFDRFAFDTMAPAIVCPVDIVVECSQTGGTPATDPTIAAFLAGASATDDCDSNVDITNDAPAFFPLGLTVVTFTATDDAGNASSCQASVDIIDTIAPTISCPADATVECSDFCGTPADDPQLDAFFAGVSASDICDADPDITNDAPTCFPLGTTTVTFTATDVSGNFNTCTADVTVEDTTPPDITVDLNRDVLWPPNHKMADILATVTVTDICCEDPTFVLTSVESNEPDNGLGDGNTVDDIQSADIGTPDTHILLRSERSGNGDGRVYTIVYTAEDCVGNTAPATVEVRVPHDQSGNAMASMGFVPSGMELDPTLSQFALVIRSTETFDATALDVEKTYLGNIKGAVKPERRLKVQNDGDLHIDLAVFYSARALSVLQDAGSIGLHYTSAEGVDYLVPDIFDLGERVPLVTSVVIPRAEEGEDEHWGDEMPTVTALTSVYPNPFNPTTTVGFSLETDATVSLRVYDVKGVLVRSLKEEHMPSGQHEVRWDGRDQQGRPVSTGVYFVRFVAGDYQTSRKIVMLK